MPAWSGLWNGVYQEPYSQIGTANQLRRLRRVWGNRMVSLKQRQILRTFVTDDVGTTATKTHTQVSAQDVNDIGTLGGKRTITTITDINRAVTAADETALLKEIDAVHTPTTWPVEKSGNSGGGKQGF